MQTQIVYCMVSDGHDWFYEQALVPVHSLRKYHPEATVLLIVDRETDNTLVGDRCELSKLLTEKVVVDVLEKCPSKNQHSCYLKTNVLQKIDKRSLVKEQPSEIKLRAYAITKETIPTIQRDHQP